MNWARGFDRLGRALLALSWAIFVVSQWGEPAERVGETFVYMLVFTFSAIALWRLGRWVIRGFLPNQR